MQGASHKVLMLLGSYDQAMHSGIARAARELSWHLDVSLLKTFRLPERWQGDGIICALNNNPKLAEFVQKADLPKVDLSIWRSDLPMPRVVADNAAIGEAAAKHLQQYSHQHFVWFALQRNPVGEARFQGFCKQLDGTKARIERLDGRGASDRSRLRLKVINLPKPCAVFCLSDDDASWLLNVCLDAGLRVPDEVAILGVDNNALICENQPIPLSSVNHDLERIGYEGAHLLQSLLLGQAPATVRQQIKPNGVTTRESTDAFAVTNLLVREALIFLKKNLRQSLGTDVIAQTLGVSRRTLEQHFREHLGCGVHAKRMELRLTLASNLLTQTRLKVEDIAAQCGFCHSPHFSRAFSTRFGHPPNAYRQHHQGTTVAAQE